MYTVLIVDDEPLVRLGIINSVKWENYGVNQIFEAANGNEAWELYQNNTVDILITDIKMPEMNGIELLRVLKTVNSKAVRIVLSGYSDFEYLQKAIRAGVMDYLLKPINVIELEEVLETAINRLREEEIQKTERMKNLRDNTFARLMEGNIGKHELRDKLEKLNIELGRGPYVVTIFQFPSSVFEEPQFFLKLDMCEEKCNKTIQRENMGLVCTMNGNLVVLYDKEISDKKIDFTNSKLEKVISLCMERPVYTYKGKTVGETEEIAFSYIDAKRQNKEKEEKKKYSKQVQDLLNYIDKHFREEISLKEAAELFYINPSYLGYVFKREYGHSFTETVNRKRIEYAKQLLLNSNIKIYEVAEKVGFMDSRYFVRVFKKYEGINPSEVRKS